MKKLLSIILSITMLLSMGTVALAEEKLGDGTPPRTYTFEELTGLTRADIDHIVIRSGLDGIGYSTAYEKIITDIYNAINTKSFLPYVQEGNSGGWLYEIIFFDKVNKKYTDNFSGGITPESGHSGLSYKSKNVDKLKAMVEKTYNLISNDCSEWSADYIVQAKDLGFLEGVTDISYKEPITREKFCEIIYNLVVLISPDIEHFIPDSFTDTKNEKVLKLNSLGIINGKTSTEFAPNDYLTREEAATIIVRMVNKIVPMAATEMWFEYDDIGEISEWASDSIQTISNLGFMKGIGNNNFAPKATYTTEQAIVTLVRVLDSAGASGLLDENTSIGIIGGADGPTSIIVGSNTTVIEDEGYNKFYAEVTKNTTKVDKFYVDEAIKLITEAGTLAADRDFISLYTTNDVMTNKLLALGAVEFNKPTDIFYLYADKEQMIANIKALAGEDAESIDFEKMEKLNKRYNFSTLASLINASYGAENLAALTILTNSRGYIMPKDFKDDFALFVQYEGEYSAIVSFSKFGDGVISANMAFVKNGDKDNVFRRLYEITSAVGTDSVTIAKVK